MLCASSNLDTFIMTKYRLIPPESKTLTYQLCLDSCVFVLLTFSRDVARGSSHDAISNHWNSTVCSTTSSGYHQQTSSPRYCTLVTENHHEPMDSTSQRASNVEGVSMTWLHHEGQTCNGFTIWRHKVNILYFTPRAFLSCLHTALSIEQFWRQNCLFNGIELQQGYI